MPGRAVHPAVLPWLFVPGWAPLRLLCMGKFLNLQENKTVCTWGYQEGIHSGRKQVPWI